MLFTNACCMLCVSAALSWSNPERLLQPLKWEEYPQGLDDGTPESLETLNNPFRTNWKQSDSHGHPRPKGGGDRMSFLSSSFCFGGGNKQQTLMCRDTERPDSPSHSLS